MGTAAAHVSRGGGLPDGSTGQLGNWATAGGRVPVDTTGQLGNSAEDEATRGATGHIGQLGKGRAIGATAEGGAPEPQRG